MIYEYNDHRQVKKLFFFGISHHFIIVYLNSVFASFHRDVLQLVLTPLCVVDELIRWIYLLAKLAEDLSSYPWTQRSPSPVSTCLPGMLPALRTLTTI